MAAKGPGATEKNRRRAADLIRLGNECGARGDIAGAEDAFTRAVAAEPGNAVAHFNLANTLRKGRRRAAAIESYRRAVAIEPDIPQFLNNLGEALLDGGEAGEAAEAATLFSQALAHGDALGPGLALIVNNLGNAQKQLGDGDAALASYRRALEIAPDFAMAMTNLGVALMARGDFAAAEAEHRRALDVEPEFVEAHYNLGVLLLLQGRTAEGWEEFEWRWRVASGERPRAFPQPPWRGEDVRGKRVLVWSEQGVGDEILFAGMVPDLVARGADVVLECERRLVPLFERSFAGVTCVAKTDPPVPVLLAGDIDYQVPGAGLARWLRPDPVAPAAPYLKADAARAQALGGKYRGGGGSLVGLAWRSKNRDIGTQKSMTLADIAPLAEIPGVRFVDLQYGDTRAERDAFQQATGVAVIHDDGIDQLADLDAFAAQVAALDLVITVSNTTAHMAGALGIPTWVMLNTVPLHCWGLDDAGSPWYGAARLFRQSAAGTWADVVGQLKARLAAFRP